MAVGETGLPYLSEVRHNINILQSRLDFLVSKIEVLGADGRDMSASEAEIRALRFAIPILEAEWDTYARMFRDQQSMEKRFWGAERRGDGVIKDCPKAWQPDVPYAGNRPWEIREEQADA